jgi:hypothetical protein
VFTFIVDANSKDKGSSLLLLLVQLQHKYPGSTPTTALKFPSLQPYIDYLDPLPLLKAT